MMSPLERRPVGRVKRGRVGRLESGRVGRIKRGQGGLLLGALSLSLTISCASERQATQETILFWAMGHEGELARDLVLEFERLHPEYRVVVEQIPWSAAHEKLVTSVVGRVTPDVSQLGNTWIAEFVALDALEPLSGRIASSQVVSESDFFPGIWDTNVIEGEPFGVPWYVDTRLLFYRTDLLASVGYDSIPDTWSEWSASLAAMKEQLAGNGYPLFLPVNEWAPVIAFGLQNGSSLLGDHDTRGAFSEKEFRGGFDFYVGLFRDGYAPPAANNEIGNLYQEFSRGYVNSFITGPWNLGELRTRLAPEQADIWSTSPLPGPRPGEPGVSLAGGSSLVLFRDSKHADAAWKLIEFLSEARTQQTFYETSGDLPARMDVWDLPVFQADPRLAAFGQQLRRVVSTPKIPEWEQIAIAVQEHAEMAVRGRADVDSTLAQLDRRVDQILTKRRWLYEEGRLVRPKVDL